MRTPCQPRRGTQDSGNASVFESGRRGEVGCGRAGNAPRGKFCRGIYAGLTINAQSQGYSGTDTLSVWGSRAMRIYGANGAALAKAPAAARRSAGGTFSVSEQEAPRNAAAAGSLRAISNVDVLIALQG